SDYSYQQQDTDYNEEIDAEYDYNDYHDDMDYAEDYGYYEEKDRHGNITFVKTDYYAEKYEYTYYRDGSVKSVKCYEDVSYK
nr:hypothetical protein [Treponemataceae bacterium]